VCNSGSLAVFFKGSFQELHEHNCKEIDFVSPFTHPKYYFDRSDEEPPQPPRDREGVDDAPPGGLTDADIDSNWEEAIETFDGMDLPEELLRGIYAYGFEKPSAIQQRAIKPTMLGRDLIAQAQSGTVGQSVCIYVIRRPKGMKSEQLTIFRV
jgi:hypothetical protein